MTLVRTRTSSSTRTRSLPEASFAATAALEGAPCTCKICERQRTRATTALNK
jgi:hypothetical protein